MCLSYCNVNIFKYWFISKKLLQSINSVNISNNPELEELGLTNLTSINGIFHVTSNRKLRKLKLPKLKTAQLSNPWANNTAVAIAHNSPQFCLALREAKIFLNYEKVSSFMFDSKVCKPGKQAKKACIVPKRIYSANTVGVLFKNNHNSLKFDSKSCISIRLAMLKAGPVCTCSPIFDDLKCEEMEQWKKQTGGK
ncbi:hypothetical protein L5515_010106 [Caenorhabditis briggsae]|uniref:Uncharacterized protein n=1 Tax=Caenorhabditis briggsae TaxID=6238 RepID=A0AAE9EPG6_CAEBR|nr:hypothetical protein L5515_010106 [Caenorhabditis briggsae]